MKTWHYAALGAGTGFGGVVALFALYLYPYPLTWLTGIVATALVTVLVGSVAVCMLDREPECVMPERIG